MAKASGARRPGSRPRPGALATWTRRRVSFRMRWFFPHSLGLDWRLRGGDRGSPERSARSSGSTAWEPWKSPRAGTVGQATAPATAAAAGDTVSVSPLSFGLAPPVLLQTPGTKPLKNFMAADPPFVLSFAPLGNIRCPTGTCACGDVQRRRLAETGRTGLRHAQRDAQHRRSS